jgi:transcriptional regulator with XRE-family HTH domain
MAKPLARIELGPAASVKDLSVFLRSARHAGKRTQLEVSTKMQIPPTAVARIESGTLEPKVLTMNRFARALGRRLVITIE